MWINLPLSLDTFWKQANRVKDFSNFCRQWDFTYWERKSKVNLQTIYLLLATIYQKLVQVFLYSLIFVMRIPIV
jgi:hypothetical protein